MTNKFRKFIGLAIFINVVIAQMGDKQNQGLVQSNKKNIIINLQNNFGYTIVDVGQAMEIPAFSDITKTGLVDWDQFNYKGLVQVFLDRGKMLVGGELGFNRLYRWEERYQTFIGNDRWRWDTIWTWHLGALIQLNITEQYYLTTGAGVYTFFNGSGAAVGFPLALGHVIKFNDKISIPLEFRTDIIFGNGTPITIGGGIGLKFGI